MMKEIVTMDPRRANSKAEEGSASQGAAKKEQVGYEHIYNEEFDITKLNREVRLWGGLKVILDREKVLG